MGPLSDVPTMIRFRRKSNASAGFFIRRGGFRRLPNPTRSAYTSRHAWWGAEPPPQRGHLRDIRRGLSDGDGTLNVRS